MSEITHRGHSVYIPEGPPVRKKRKVPIWSVLPQITQIVRPFQPRIVKVGTHWIPTERRTLFCKGREHCSHPDHSRDDDAARWTGYLLCRLEPVKHKVGDREMTSAGTHILHITPAARLSCPPLDDPAVDLTRFDIICWRKGETKRSECEMEIRSATTKPISPSDFDTLGYLIEMFNAPNNLARRALRGADE